MASASDEDLEAIAHYISADSTAYAAAVVKAILNTTRNLSEVPFAGRVVPELGDENIASGLRIVTESSIELRSGL